MKKIHFYSIHACMDFLVSTLCELLSYQLLNMFASMPDLSIVSGLQKMYPELPCQSKLSQNSAKIQSKYSQYSVKCNHNAGKMQAKYTI